MAHKGCSKAPFLTEPIEELYPCWPSFCGTYKKFELFQPCYFEGAHSGQTTKMVEASEFGASV